VGNPFELRDTDAEWRLLDRKVVQITTWAASMFLVGLVLIALLGRDDAPLLLAINPAVAASIGWVMILRDRYSVPHQLLPAMVTLAMTVVFFEPVSSQDPVIGLIGMGIGGVLFVRRYSLVFVGAAAISVFVVAYSTAAPAVGAERWQLAFGDGAGFLFLAWLVYWMKCHWAAGQTQLQDLIRSKDQLVASVSHELRTPMTSVVGLARELDDRFDDFEYEEVRELLNLMVHESTDVANILEDLLVAARAEVGTISLDMQALDIYSEINWALTTASAGVRQAADVREPAFVIADPGRVRQILRNLVVNARRYGGPAVRVIVEPQGDAVAISVRDDGAPIAAEDRRRIFEPYQGKIGSRNVPGSVGLGLTVSRQLARLMGGDLGYDHDGTESVFTLTLRASEPPNRNGQRVGPAQRRPTRTVLEVAGD
jgi:signal transduction histidine kinase